MSNYRAIYAGIGSRKTPEIIQNYMTQIAQALRLSGCLLRSGGAKGADIAFEKGAAPVCEIFYANKLKHKNCDWQNALVLAEKFHPNWNALNKHTKLLMARNCFQILGEKLDNPVNFVVCWTPDGVEEGTATSRLTGGTGQAIRVASASDIKVYNLYNYTEQEIQDIIKKIEKSSEKNVKF